jgi:hypothetical protein
MHLHSPSQSSLEITLIPTWMCRHTLEMFCYLSQKIHTRKNNLLDIDVAFIYIVVQMDNNILKDNNENRI